MIIGMIGLGLMGRAMSVRLLHAGHQVLGYDIKPEACALAADVGVTVMDDARAIAPLTRTVLLSLMTSEDRRALLWGSQSLADALQPETLILDTTTGRPEDIEEDARRLAMRNVTLVDVCMAGSSQVMRDGGAVALVGDARESAGYHDLLAVLSKAAFYLGAPGQGNRVKLIVNLVFGLHRLVLAEALGLASHAGFDLATVLEILKTGDTYSAVMDAKGPKMVAGIYEPPAARLAQHAKDVHLILDYARQVHAKVPVSETHVRIIDDLVAQGWGGLDNAAIFKAFE